LASQEEIHATHAIWEKPKHPRKKPIQPRKKPIPFNAILLYAILNYFGLFFLGYC
jgi:hypothetical protein